MSKRGWKVRPFGESYWCFLESVAELADLMGQVEESWEVRRVDMTEEEFDALPEFDGW